MNELAIFLIKLVGLAVYWIFNAKNSKLKKNRYKVCDSVEREEHECKRLQQIWVIYNTTMKWTLIFSSS
jgi:hypothetical protein